MSTEIPPHPKAGKSVKTPIGDVDNNTVDNTDGDATSGNVVDEVNNEDQVPGGQSRVKKGSKTAKGDEHTTDGSDSDPAVNASEGETSDDAIPPSESLLREVSAKLTRYFYILTDTLPATCTLHATSLRLRRPAPKAQEEDRSAREGQGNRLEEHEDRQHEVERSYDECDRRNGEGEDEGDGWQGER